MENKEKTELDRIKARKLNNLKKEYNTFKKSTIQDLHNTYSQANTEIEKKRELARKAKMMILALNLNARGPLCR